MSVGYAAVSWNRQKKRYDLAFSIALAVGAVAFVGGSLARNPAITAETLIIRTSAITAFLLMHAILAIGPLARLDRRFLPLLFNRRHLGVAMFLLSAVHAGISIFQFHALAPGVNPLVSVFTAYRIDYLPHGGASHFPFEPFGALALGILFLMAATSHDFWLRNLGAGFWKTLHLAVLVAYGAIVAHVAFGVLQYERHPIWIVLLGVGAIAVLGLHVAAGWREVGSAPDAAAGADRLVRACDVAALRDGRAKVVRVDRARIAIWLLDGRAYGTSNVCRHQGGPLGEGRILNDGCVTCPWHGWQYRPSDGRSPPPFEERIETYRVEVRDGAVWVDPAADPPGTPQPGAAITAPREENA